MAENTVRPAYILSVMFSLPGADTAVSLALPGTDSTDLTLCSEHEEAAWELCALPRGQWGPLGDGLDGGC